MNSILKQNVHELKVLETRNSINNTNQTMMSANIPEGYKFLCWVGFGVNGNLTWASTAYHMYQATNIRVWLGANSTGEVIGTYLVYK